MDSSLRTSVRVTARGCIVIPAEVRRRLGMEVGTKLIPTVEGDHAILASAQAARRRARQQVRRYISPGVNLSRELMAERKTYA